MRVAILTSGFFPVIDGVTITVFKRVQRLSQLGHQVLLLCPDYRAIASVYPNWQTYVGEIFPGVTVVPLESAPFMGLEFERNVKKSAYPSVLKALQAFQPDIIHVDEPERLQLGFDKIPAVDFAKRNQIPCVSFLHTNFIEYLEDYFTLPKFIIAAMQCISKRIVSHIYNAYDATFVSSSTTYQKAVKMGIKNAVQAELLGVDLAAFDPQLKTADFFVQNYGITDLNSSSLDSANLRSKSFSPNPKVRLLFLGRLTPDKGWKFTLDAFSHMAQSPQYQPLLRQIVLIIAGDGSMLAEIDRTLSPLLTVHCLGRVSPENVPALLLNSDIHVTTSEKETKGLTLLEAFAAGIPVLAPEAGGVIDTIRSGENGLLFEPQNWQDFAAKLQQLVDQPDLRHTLGANAKQTVAHHDWNDAIDRLIQCWQQQIAAKRTQTSLPHQA